MKSLQTIQKTFRVFQILTKIAFIFSIVGASLCAAGALALRPGTPESRCSDSLVSRSPSIWAVKK